MKQAPPEEDTSELLARVESIVFRSDDARFAVLRVRSENDGREHVAVGPVGGVAEGEMLRLRGRWQRHPTYGKQLAVRSYAPVTPSTAEGIARYLGSGLVPGIGSSLAHRLVKRFGDRTLEVITSESRRLQEVSGIGARRAQAIAEAVRARREEADTLAYLQGLGLGPALSARVLRRYGGDAVRVVRDDPYRMADQVPGVGFRTADQIGAACGFAHDDPRRAAGVVLHLVGKAADDGHVYTPVDQLLEAADSLEVPTDRVREAIEALAARGRLVVEDDAAFASPLHRAEVAIARRLASLAGERHDAPRAHVERSALAGGLAAAQQRAVELSLSRGLLVITGGPGTGKTTTVRALVDAQDALERRVLLCAPTGRAAKRLSEATGRDASTIHRLLEFNPATGRFTRDASAPLNAALVLVDEASMLDVMLAHDLLQALPQNAALVLVGDVDQLPPVGPGQVLRDVIASGVAEVVRLTEVFRQAQQSAIVRAAHAILHGRRPTPTPSGTRGSGDFFLVRCDDPESAGSRVLETLQRIRERYRLDIRHDVQVLAPMRRGPAGVEQLNATLQHALNPSNARAIAGLRPGDKVMQLRNDYDRDVFNGDLGEVLREHEEGLAVSMGGREVVYDREALDALTLAYASTIHKVQGSEFPAVVVVLHSTHYVMLSRALLYTAVTRAKQLVVLVGDARALKRAVSHARNYDSRSRLAERLRDAYCPATSATPRAPHRGSPGGTP